MSRLLLALLLPAAAQEAASPLHSRMEEVRAETQRIIETLTPKLNEFRDMQQQYLVDEDLPAIDARREALVKELRSGASRLYELINEIQELKQNFYMSTSVSFLATLGAKGKSTGIGSDVPISNALAFEDFYRQAAAFRKELTRTLESEHAAYEETKRAVAHRKRLLLIGGLLLAAVLLGLLLAYFYGQRQSPPTGPLTAYATLPGAADPPASGPAMPLASGPAGLGAPTGAGGADVIDGNYKIEREIGRGGMGLVYEATDLTLQRKVAIKRMKSEVVANNRELEMFLGEARTVAALKHPNLVEIHSIVRENGQLYLVFEFVDGQGLQEILEKGERLPPARVKELLAPVAEALDYAHAMKVIHRDLKPSNIMLTQDGKVKLMDFGIAHQAKKTAAMLTRAEAWGTPPYMAPEQELGTVQKESDHYSMAVMAYEMLCAELPFAGPNFLAQKREMLYTPPSQIDPALALADAFIARGLAADPNARFHSGAEFVAALGALA